MTAADLSRCRLYGILDLSYVDSLETSQVTEQMIAGGIDLIQLRAKALLSAEIAKIAAELHCITMKRSIPLIINDHPEIAQTYPDRSPRLPRLVPTRWLYAWLYTLRRRDGSL